MSLGLRDDQRRRTHGAWRSKTRETIAAWGANSASRAASTPGVFNAPFTKAIHSERRASQRTDAGPNRRGVKRILIRVYEFSH